MDLRKVKRLLATPRRDTYPRAAGADLMRPSPVLLVARDAAHFKSKFSCLSTRTTYQGLTELHGLL